MRQRPGRNLPDRAHFRTGNGLLQLVSDRRDVCRAIPQVILFGVESLEILTRPARQLIFWYRQGRYANCLYFSRQTQQLLYDAKRHHQLVVFIPPAGENAADHHIHGLVRHLEPEMVTGLPAVITRQRMAD